MKLTNNTKAILFYNKVYRKNSANTRDRLKIFANSSKKSKPLMRGASAASALSSYIKAVIGFVAIQTQLFAA